MSLLAHTDTVMAISPTKNYSIPSSTTLDTTTPLDSQHINLHPAVVVEPLSTIPAPLPKPKEVVLKQPTRKLKRNTVKQVSFRKSINCIVIFPEEIMLVKTKLA